MKIIGKCGACGGDVVKLPEWARVPSAPKRRCQNCGRTPKQEVTLEMNEDGYGIVIQEPIFTQPKITINGIEQFTDE